MFSFSHSKNLITFKGFLFLLFVHCLDCFLDWLWWKWPYKLLFSTTQSDALLLNRGALTFTWSSCFFINMPTKACEITFFIYYSPSSNQEHPSVFQIPRNLKGDQDSTKQNNSSKKDLTEPIQQLSANGRKANKTWHGKRHSWMCCDEYNTPSGVNKFSGKFTLHNLLEYQHTFFDCITIAWTSPYWNLLNSQKRRWLWVKFQETHI